MDWKRQVLRKSGLENRGNTKNSLAVTPGDLGQSYPQQYPHLADAAVTTFTEPLVGVGHQLVDRAQIDGGNGSGQGGKPGANRIVGQVITSAASLPGGEHRNLFSMSW